MQEMGGDKGVVCATPSSAPVLSTLQTAVCGHIKCVSECAQGSVHAECRWVCTAGCTH